MAVALLVFQDAVAPALEIGEAALMQARDAAVEPDGGTAEIGEEAAVVADHDDRRTDRGERLFQRLDGDHVEMVGRLVEEQDVRVRRQHTGERRATAFATGQALRVFCAGEIELVEQPPHAVRIVAGAQARRDEGFRGREAGEIRLLREIAHRRAGLQEALTGIGLDQPRRDPQQRRLAGAVAADQRQPFSGSHRQFGAGKQRRAAEGQVDVLEKEERRCHG